MQRSWIVPVLGVVRLGIGAGLLVRPEGMAEALGVQNPGEPGVRWLARLIGAREIGIGVGTLLSAQSAPRPWILAQGISDTSDAVAFSVLTAQGRIAPAKGWGLATFAASGAVSEVLTALIPKLTK